jgi:hypothetical protein
MVDGAREQRAQDRGTLDARGIDQSRPLDLPVKPDLPPIPSWVRIGTAPGVPNASDITGLAVDPDTGDVIVVGWFFSELQLLTIQLTAASTDSEDMFVARFLPDGTLLWARRYGGAGKEIPRGVVVAGGGRIVIAGSFSGNSPEIGLSTGDLDGFVLALDGQGNPIWAKRFGGKTADEARGLALDGSGTLYVVGSVSGTYELQSVNYTTKGAIDLLVVTVPAGTPPAPPAFGVRTTIYGGGISDVLHGFAIAVGGGSVCVTGDFLGKLSTYTSATQDVLAACFTPSLQLEWVKGVGSGISDLGAAIAVDQDDVYVTGRAGDTTDFGCGPLGSIGSTPFLARLKRLGGGCSWSKGFGAGPSTSGQALVAHGAGLLIAGDVEATLVLPPGQLKAVGSRDAFIVRLDENAPAFVPDYVWGERFSGPASAAAAHAVAVDPNRKSVFVGGSFTGTFKLLGTTATANEQDIFLYRRPFD